MTKGIQTEFIISDKQKQSGYKLQEGYLEKHLPVLRQKFNAAIYSRKDVVVIGKKNYIHEYKPDKDNFNRFIDNKPYDKFRKSLSPEQQLELDNFDDGLTQFNIDLFKIFHGCASHAFLWGIHDVLKNSNEFGLKLIKKAKPEIKDLFGNLVPDVINYLNDRAKTDFKPTTANSIKYISDRASEGYVLNDFKKAIDRQVLLWYNDTKMRQYLRPSTLFNSEKFPEYVHGTTIEQPIRDNASGSGFANGNATGTATDRKMGGGGKKHDAFEKLENIKRN